MNIHLQKILPMMSFLFILAFIISFDNIHIHDNSILSKLFGVNVKSSNGNTEIIRVDKKRFLSPVQSMINMILSKILKAIFDFPLSGATVKTYSCFGAFGLAKVDFTNVERFPDWFNNDSVMELYAAGEYKGLDGITEYVNFVYSDDFEETKTTTDMFLFTEEITADSDSCNITYVQNAIHDMSTDLYPENTCFETPVAFASRFKLTGDETFVTFEKINVFYFLSQLNNFFGSVKDGAVAERVCGIMEENCEDVWTENAFANQTECQATVDSMPKIEGEGYFDGRSQGCRWLHSVFAKENERHCPHISTIPLEDTDGSIKCQESQAKPASDVFSEAELDFIYDISMNELGYAESFTKSCGD